MENKEEYYCTECNSKVDEKDTVCKNCGADLTETAVESGWSRFNGKLLSFINKFSKYHRISYYLFLGPFLILISSILLGILGIIYSELLRDTVENLGVNYIFDYFTYILATVPYILPVFVFTHLYLNVSLKLKVIITISVIFILLLSLLVFKYFGLNTLGIIPLTVILLEIVFLKYTKKDYSILIITSILFLGWFQFLSLGDLPRETVIKDYKNITKPLNVIKSKVDFISVPENYQNYDMTIPYIIVTKKDTLQLVLNYNKINTVSIPSQHWKLINWKIDSVFSSVYYYPKPKI